MSNKQLNYFTIVMDDKEKKTNRNFFGKLIDSVSDKLCPVKVNDTKLKSLRALLENEYRFKHGYTIDVECDEIVNTNKYFLMRDFDKLVKLLNEYLGDKPKVKKSKEYEIEITIERPKVKKLRKVTSYDKVTILERWVKIGYEMYRRQLDSFTGVEFIVVDDDVYLIKRDRYGREYLA